MHSDLIFGTRLEVYFKVRHAHPYHSLSKLSFPTQTLPSIALLRVIVKSRDPDIFIIKTFYNFRLPIPNYYQYMMNYWIKFEVHSDLIFGTRLEVYFKVRHAHPYHSFSKLSFTTQTLKPILCLKWLWGHEIQTYL